MLSDDATKMRTVRRKGVHVKVGGRLRAWLLAIQHLDHNLVPASSAILQAKAVGIGRALKLDDFSASTAYLRGLSYGAFCHVLA